MATGTIGVWKVFNAVTVAAGGNSSSGAVIVPSNAEGNFALEYTVTGTGTCKFEALDTYDDGTTWVEQNGQADIAAGVTAGSDIVAFQTQAIQKKIKIKCTETGGANAVVVTARLRIQ